VRAVRSAVFAHDVWAAIEAVSRRSGAVLTSVSPGMSHPAVPLSQP
jgi:hypothetical protein